MTAQTALARRQAFFGTIIQDDKDKSPESYRDIADANNHLHKVVNALLKERTGQPLSREEEQLITECVAAKRWQLEHTKQP